MIKRELQFIFILFFISVVIEVTPKILYFPDDRAHLNISCTHINVQ